MSVLHTSAGDRWRKNLCRRDGSLSNRVCSIQEEQFFWHERMKAGLPKRDSYADAVWKEVCRITEQISVSSVLEIGPGWGNYTFSLCRSFGQAACVDISPDNLKFLKEKAGKEGLSLSTYCSEWESVQVGLWDLVFGYNCLYRVREPELFLQKMNDSARKLCVIGMNRPPEFPWIYDLEKAGLELHYTRQGCKELSDVLFSLGIQGKVITIPNYREYRYSDREMILSRAEQFLLKPCPRERLWELLAPYHKRVGEKWICEYPFESQLLVWAPVK